MFDKAKFFAALRMKDSGLFSTRLTQQQVVSLEIILDECLKRQLPVRYSSYIFATAYHEVGRKMVPVAENLNYTSAKSICDTWPKRFPTLESAKPFVRQAQKLANHVYGGRLGNDRDGDGWRYRGRGFPQTTGKENYHKSSELVAFDLVANPDLMLDPHIATVTMVESMLRGLYTGKRLGDYLAQKADYVGARAIINADGKKNGAKIAAYAKSFERALVAAGYLGSPAETKPVQKEPEPSEVLIRNVQTLLVARGYHEVGKIDGLMGSRTRGAILAFEADNGLPPKGLISDETLAALVKAPNRPVAPARQNADAKALKHQGDTIVRKGDWLQKIGGAVLVSMGLGGVSEGVVNLDEIRQGITSMRELLDTVGTLGPWILGLGIGAVVFFLGRQIITDRVHAYREGRFN